MKRQAHAAALHEADTIPIPASQRSRLFASGCLLLRVAFSAGRTSWYINLDEVSQEGLVERKCLATLVQCVEVGAVPCAKGVTGFP